MSIVSFICVYNNEEILNQYLMPSLNKQNTEYELILIDNRENQFNSAASALNYGGRKAKGKYLIFTHQDILIDNPNWIEETVQQLEKLKNWGIAGVAGKTNDRHIRTNIKHGIDSVAVSPFNLKKPIIASTVDECLFIIPKDVFSKYSFDEENCFDWHLYATDYVLSIQEKGYDAYVIPTYLEHKSKGSSMSKGYYDTLKKLQKKHHDKKIIRNTMADWYTFLPVFIQKMMHDYNRKTDYQKLNFFDRYYTNKMLNQKYRKVALSLRKLIRNSGYFDEDYYKRTYKHQVDFDKCEPISHYCTVGFRKDYNPSLLFDTKYYKSQYPNILKYDKNPLHHYLQTGILENKIISPVLDKSFSSRFKRNLMGLFKNNPKIYFLLKSRFNKSIANKYLKDYELIKNSGYFDTEFYIDEYPNILDFKLDPIVHYMFLGSRCNYKPNKFFVGEKRNRKSIPLLDFLSSKYDNDITDEDEENHDIIEMSDLFDNDYYLNNYPDSKDYSYDSIYHYLKIGFKKGYNPSKNFDNDWYLEVYPDVKKSCQNPLINYLTRDEYEKKITKPLNAAESDEIMRHIDYNARKLDLYPFDENSPLVSIIILNRNGVDYLKTLFKNFSETICYPNYEIIVFDNDSTDESVSYLKELSKNLPLTIIENDKNDSFSEANNKCAKIAKGKYLVLLNNDMEPIYGWLNHMMSSYLKSEDIGIVGAKLIFPRRDGDPTSLRTQNEGIKYTELSGFLTIKDGYIVPYNIYGNEVFSNDFEDHNMEDIEMASILGAALLIKKELYEEVGGLDEVYFYNYEDIDLCFKTIKKGYKVIYAPKAKLYHYYQATRIDTFDKSYTDIKNRCHLYEKWNKWLAEMLFMDKINNDLIFSENPLKISLVSTDALNLKKYLNINDAELKILEDEKFISSVKIDNLGWDLYFNKTDGKERISLTPGTDILVSDVMNFNPDFIKKNNMHQIKIAIINSNPNDYEFLENYDLLLFENNFYEQVFGENDLFSKNGKRFIRGKTAYCLNHGESIFLQIKNILKDIHDNDIFLFNEIIKNPDLTKLPNTIRDYLDVFNSNYFDFEWYKKHYQINRDPVNHYLHNYLLENINPSPNFNGRDYLLANPDLKSRNPLIHYENYGKNENRDLKSTMKDRFLYNLYKFLIDDDIFPYTRKIFPVKNNQIFFYSPWDNNAKGDLGENSKIVFDNVNEKYKKLIYTKKRTSIGHYFYLLRALLQSKVIVIDNGCSFLSEFELKNSQKVINIWHACGAFKKIVFDVPIYSENALNSLKKQVSQYSNFIVSSENIVDIYANAHHMDEKDVLGLGVPRTDLFYNEEYLNKELSKLYDDYPLLKEKEIILYAPTFRDNFEFKTYIDWDKLSQSLDENEIFVIKRHIRIGEDLLEGKTYDNIIYIDDESVLLLMYIAKLMITDYSSVIFEYSLLNKPLIHYCPDYEQYVSIRDFYLDFDNELFGDIIKDPGEFVEKIANKDYGLDEDRLKSFKDKYMSACDGHATERVVELIENYMEG